MLADYSYRWPREEFAAAAGWRPVGARGMFAKDLPEDRAALAADSRWPGFFPSPICFVTTESGGRTALEKVVGASIVNRFPYVIALSFCREELSERHHVRAEFMRLLESGGIAAVQFLPPGRELDRVMETIGTVPDSCTSERLLRTGLSTRGARSHGAAIFDDAYLVYEARLVAPGYDFQGQPVYGSSWLDVGSHRVYFLEITAIQLRKDIAEGSSQIRWRSLPDWNTPEGERAGAALDRLGADGRYAKGYTPDYRFPAASTIAFEADETRDGMAIKYLPPLPKDQVEVDNDRARWPCFFPSSVGMITSWDGDVPNLMPCGSTTIVSRHPLIITPCVSYAAINERYAPRHSLGTIRRTGRFGCGVPFANDAVVASIRYAGNMSLRHDINKIAHAGLDVEPDPWAPVVPSLPIHFDCQVVGEVRLGTHIMFLGEVKKVRVRSDVSPSNPMVWCPWADVVRVPSAAGPA